MSYSRTVNREASFRSLMEIGKVGEKYFSCRLQPSQMCQLKMASGLVVFLLGIVSAFLSASHFPITPINALLVFGPAMLGVLAMMYASMAMNHFFRMRREGETTWAGCLANQLAHYLPEDEESYQRMISSLLAKSLAEEAFHEWMNIEYRALCGGDALVPDHFGKHDWNAMMRLSLRYSPR